MRVLNLRTAALALVAGIGLSGCAYGPYSGLGVGVGYGDGYGYGDPYYGGYGYGAGYGYGDPYYGWYDGFYYPGTGYYVYDRYRRPYRWTDSQRRYWEVRRDRARRNGVSQIISSWGRFEDGSSAAVRQQSVNVRNQQAQRQFGVERQQVRSERQQARSERQSARSSAREERIERRRSRRNDD